MSRTSVDTSSSTGVTPESSLVLSGSCAPRTIIRRHVMSACTDTRPA